MIAVHATINPSWRFTLAETLRVFAHVTLGVIVRSVAPGNFRRLMLIGCLVSLAGCDIPERPPLLLGKASLRSHSIPADPIEPSDSATEIIEPPGGSHTASWETWDAYFVGNRNVGFNHVRAEPVSHDINPDIRYRHENLLYVNQGTARTIQRLLQISTETNEGRLIGFESSLQVGPVMTRFQGAVNDNRLRVEMVRGSAPTVRHLPWESTYRGLVAIEQSLRKKPLTEKGSARVLKLLLPGRYELATVRLRCSGQASVPLIDGTMRSLIEINIETQLASNPPSKSTIWTDTAGEVLRSYWPENELIAYRTDEATASRMSQDVTEVVAITVAGNIERSAEAQRLAIKVSPSEAAVRQGRSLEIPPAPGQLVRRLDDGSFQILVSRRTEVPARGFVASDLDPAELDSQPNYFVDAGATMIRRFAEAAIGARQLSDREVAIELTQMAHTMVNQSDAFSGLVRASDIARDSVGDCSGRAVLLAALLRARKIPSRVAIGLKYSPEKPQRMIYRMWTLAYVDGQWLHLDATDGGIAPADRLTISTTHLGGGKEYMAFVPFLEATSRMKIEILKVQY